MLPDISNNLNIPTGAHSQGKKQKHVKPENALRSLKIVARTQADKIGNEKPTSMSTKQYPKKQAKLNSAGNLNKSNPASKMQEYPNYKFGKMFENADDIIFPYYHTALATENIYTKNNELKLDFTNDITYFRNTIRKYSKPIDYKYISKHEFNIFNNFKNQTDPIEKCFRHMPGENKLRFGDFSITVETDGVYTKAFEPVNEKRDSSDDIDEVLYRSDEGETSRLENSDLDITDDEISDGEVSRKFDGFEEVGDDEREDDDNNDSDYEGNNSSILNSSLISQNVQGNPPIGFPSALLTNKPDAMISSPIRNAPVSPQKQELLFRTLKNKSSPIKALKTQRSGLNLNQVTKAKTKSLSQKNTNYSKWDNSMTISAKAIMKMVDESLVSSDTELYNHSFSFLGAKANRNLNSASTNPATDGVFNIGDRDISINAADLLFALNDPEDTNTAVLAQMMDLRL